MGTQVKISAADGWYINEKKDIVFPVKAPDGAPIDVSTWKAKWVLQKNSKPVVPPDAPLLEKTTDDDIDVEEGPEAVLNCFVVRVNADDTTDVRPNVELYQELKRTDVNEENVLAAGPVTLNPSAIPV